MSKLKNKVVLITGSAKRLGRELAIAFAQEGAILALHYYQSEKEAKKLKQTLQKKKVVCDIFKADMAHVSDVKNMVSFCFQKFHHIDILVNNAATFFPTPFNEIDEKNWDHFLNTNLKGPFFCIQAIANHMKDRPFKVINIADSGTPKTRSKYLPYWVSKVGILAMTETLAKALPHIQINSISPGPIAFSEDLQRLKKDITTAPQEIVDTALFLAKKANAITGNVFIIDRGRRYL